MVWVDYQKYLSSTKWQRRRRKYYSTHQKKCRACGSKKEIQLHHKTYRRIGNERDQDLVALCKKHHIAIHNIQKSSGRNLWLCTEEFIREWDNRKNRYKTLKRPKRKIRK